MAEPMRGRIGLDGGGLDWSWALAHLSKMADLAAVNCAAICGACGEVVVLYLLVPSVDGVLEVLHLAAEADRARRAKP